MFIPNDNSNRALGLPAVFDRLGAVSDRFGAVFDSFSAVFDRLGAVFDRFGAGFDRPGGANGAKTIENGATIKYLNSTRTARPPKGLGSSSRIQMLKSSLRQFVSPKCPTSAKNLQTAEKSRG